MVFAATSSEAAIIASGSVDQTIDTSASFGLDIDGDSANEFFFDALHSKGGAASAVGPPDPDQDSARLSSVVAGSSWLQGDASGAPARLAAAAPIDGTGTFSSQLIDEILSSSFGPGFWQTPYPVSGFVGVRFDLAGSNHFGWIEVTANGPADIVLNQWAYESQSDTAILAGDTGSGSSGVPIPGTATLMVSAIGALALARARRRRP